MVTLFYHNALIDKQLGHFFVLELGDDITSEEWTEHIDLLVSFWASIFLDEARYKGDPYGPHFSIVGLEKEDFKRWVELFSEICDEVYVPNISKLFKNKGLFYAKDFMRRIDEDRNLKDLTRLKSKIGWE